MNNYRIIFCLFYLWVLFHSKVLGLISHLGMISITNGRAVLTYN